MFNIAYRMLGDYDEACDVVQERFLAAYKSMANLRLRPSFHLAISYYVNYTKNRLKTKKKRGAARGFIN